MGFCQRVGKTVSKIEARGVAAFPILAPGRSGEINLFGVDWYDLQIGTDDEEIKFSASGFALSGFKDDSCFKYRGR